MNSVDLPDSPAPKRSNFDTSASSRWASWRLRSVARDRSEFGGLTCKNSGLFDLEPDGTLAARCVAVDTEPKVVQRAQQLTNASGASIFRKRSVAFEQSGRGNNWAMGFYGRGGTKMLDRVLELVRHDAERHDSMQQILMLHSVAGGTGSGLGSRLIMELRDQYPEATLGTASIAPFQTGETALQHLNLSLTLNALLEFSDCCFWFSNDEMRSASKAAASSSSSSATSTKSSTSRSSSSTAPMTTAYDQVNRLIAGSLLSMITPVGCSDRWTSTTTSSMSWWARPSLHSLVSTCCPIPQVPVLQIVNSDLDRSATLSQQWNSLISSFRFPDRVGCFFVCKPKNSSSHPLLSSRRLPHSPSLVEIWMTRSLSRHSSSSSRCLRGPVCKCKVQRHLRGRSSSSTRSQR